MKKYSVLFLMLFLLLLFLPGCGSPPSGSLDNFSQKSSGDVQINVTPQISYQGEDVKLSIQVLDKNGKELPVNRDEISLILMDESVLPIPADDDTKIDPESSPAKIPVGMALEEPDYRRLFWEDKHSSWAYIASSNSGECRGEVRVKAEDYEGQASFSFSVKKATPFSYSPLLKSYSRALSGGGTEVGLYLCWERVKGTLYYNVKAKSATDSFEIATTGEERLDEGTLPRPAFFLGGIYSQSPTPEFLLDMEQYLRLRFWDSKFEAAPVSGKAAPTTKILYINDYKETPESIYPGESTTIKARLSCNSGWVAHNLRWRIIINGDKDTVRTSDWVYGSKVSWVWNGKDDNKKQVPSNHYYIWINATCDEKPVVLPAAFSGIVWVKDLPLPKVAKIEFVNAFIPIGSDNKPVNSIWESSSGKMVCVVYPRTMIAKDAVLPKKEASDVAPEADKEAEAPLEEMKEAPPEEEVTDVTPEATSPESEEKWLWSKKAEIKVTFEINPAPSSKLTYTIKASDPNKFITVKDQKVTFEAKSSTTTKNFELVMPSNIGIQRIPLRLKWSCLKSEENQNKPMGETVLGTGDASSCIYVTLGEPLGAMKDKLRLDVLTIANEMSKGLKTDKEVRNKLTSGVFNWLAGLGFSYHASRTHIAGNNFSFSEQMQRGFMKEKEGDCRDISALLHILCCALGVEIKLVQILPVGTKTFTTTECIVPGIQEIEDYVENGVSKTRAIPIVPRTRPFQMHQAAVLYSVWSGLHVWDPTLKFTQTPNWSLDMSVSSYERRLTKDITTPTTPFSVEKVY